MSFKHYAASRLLALSALATVILTSVSQAQMNGQDQGGQGGGFGNMMGGGWDWGMNGIGGVGLAVIVLLFAGFIFHAVRHRIPELGFGANVCGTGGL